MKVCIVGTGYVGLVTGACLADKWHSVTCVDVDNTKIETINRGVSPIHERGLEEILARNIGKNLRATIELEKSVAASDITLIAAPTPFDGKRIDLRFIEEIAAKVGAALKDVSHYHAVVVKSTVVPGTTDDVVRPILENTSGRIAGKDFGLGMNPEFLSEGDAVGDFCNPDRIVIGGIDERTIRVQEQLYYDFPPCPRICTNNKTAEMIKYTSNALLATAISFSNEIANVCASLGGIDAADVMKGVHLSRYLTSVNGTSAPVTAAIACFFEAGCGFGGSCLPKDIAALIAHAEEAGAEMPMLRAVLDINQRQPSQIVQLIERHFDSLDGLRVAVLGLSFKPGTDDMRESPAILVLNDLLAKGAAVKAFDPAAMPRARKIFAGRAVEFSETLNDAIADAQAIVIVTRWEQFKTLPQLVAKMSEPPLIVDGRRMLAKTDFARYTGIGL